MNGRTPTFGQECPDDLCKIPETVKSIKSQAWRLSALGWTQTEIAERLGVSQPKVHDELSEIPETVKLIKSLASTGGANPRPTEKVREPGEAVQRVAETFQPSAPRRADGLETHHTCRKRIVTRDYGRFPNWRNRDPFSAPFRTGESSKTLTQTLTHATRATGNCRRVIRCQRQAIRSSRQVITYLVGCMLVYDAPRASNPGVVSSNLTGRTSSNGKTLTQTLTHRPKATVLTASTPGHVVTWVLCRRAGRAG